MSLTGLREDGAEALAVAAFFFIYWSSTEIYTVARHKHYLPIDLSRLGRENRREIFLPTDEPHGQIEATLTRAT